MKKQRNRYKNSIDIPWLAYTVTIGVLFLAFGCGYVYFQNQHIVKEDTKRELQQEIKNLQDETSRLGNHLLAARAAESLKPKLQQTGSVLEPIPATVIVRVSPVDVYHDRVARNMR